MANERVHGFGCIYAGEFEDVEENKLIYTDLFQQYTQLVGELLDVGSSCIAVSAFSYPSYVSWMA